MAKTKLPDRDTLYQLYVVEQLPIAEIARRYNATQGGTRKALWRKGVVRGPAGLRLTEDRLADIKRLFDAGLSQVEIARQLGASQPTVSALIRRYGWTRPTIRQRKATARPPKGE